MCIAVEGPERNLSVRHPMSLPGGGRHRHLTTAGSTEQPGDPSTRSVVSVCNNPGRPGCDTTPLPERSIFRVAVLPETTDRELQLIGG